MEPHAITHSGPSFQIINDWHQSATFFKRNLEGKLTDGLVLFQMLMTVHPTRAKMAEHVKMESTVLPARVYWVTLETTVRQVRT